MNWLLRACLGPTVWAVAFTVVYALHGTGCAREWTEVLTPLGSLHHVVLIGAFLVALVAAVWVWWAVPRGEGIKHTIIAAGGWIGVAGVLLTLFPVLGVSSCG